MTGRRTAATAGATAGLMTAILVLGVAPAWAGPARSAPPVGSPATAGPVPRTDPYGPGHGQTWTVPPGVTGATFVVNGAQGGAAAAVDEAGSDLAAPGGLGGRATVTVAVSAGDTWTLDVGAQPRPAAAGAAVSIAGGGGGGRSTLVAPDGTTVVAVAAGGGGAGASCLVGGGCTALAGGAGGGNGDPAGDGAAAPGPGSSPVAGGGGGAATGGPGAGGTAAAAGTAGAAGSAALGGTGATGGGTTAASVTFALAAGSGGDGGYGGGGGAVNGDPDTDGSYAAAAGGGGSSLADPAPVDPSGTAALAAGVNAGDGTVTVTYDTFPATVAGTTILGAVTNRPYSTSYALGGRPVPTVAVSAGALPRGLVLAGDGALSGVPTAAGTYDATITATNRWGSADLPVHAVVQARAAIGSMDVWQGSAGPASSILVPVTLDAPAPAHGVSLRWQVVGGTARAGVDYRGKPSGSVTFPADSQSAGISLKLLPRSDPGAAGVRTLVIALQPSATAALGTNAAVGTVTIHDEPPAAPGSYLSVGSLVVAHPNQTASGPSPVVKIPVLLSAPSPTALSVPYRLVGGTARPGVDFVVRAGRFTMSAGAVSGSIRLALLASALACGTLTVQLGTPTGTGVALQPDASTAVVTLADADAPLACR